MQIKFMQANSAYPDQTPRYAASKLDLYCSHMPNNPGPEVIIKLFSCSTQLGMKFFLLKNVEMPTIVGILTL